MHNSFFFFFLFCFAWILVSMSAVLFNRIILWTCTRHYERNTHTDTQRHVHKLWSCTRHYERSTHTDIQIHVHIRAHTHTHFVQLRRVRWTTRVLWFPVSPLSPSDSHTLSVCTSSSVSATKRSRQVWAGMCESRASTQTY